MLVRLAHPFPLPGLRSLHVFTHWGLVAPHESRSMETLPFFLNLINTGGAQQTQPHRLKPHLTIPDSEMARTQLEHITLKTRALANGERSAHRVERPVGSSPKGRIHAAS